MESNVRVKVLSIDGRAALIESRHNGVSERRIVPREALDGALIDPETFALGIEYGLPWEELWSPEVTPGAVAAALRQRGIWTLADLRREPGKAIAALQSVYRLDLTALLAAAERAAPRRDGE